MAGIYEYSDVGPASYWNDSGFNLIMRNLYQLMRFIKNIQINFELIFKKIDGRLVLDSFKKA